MKTRTMRSSAACAFKSGSDVAIAHPPASGRHWKSLARCFFSFSSSGLTGCGLRPPLQAACSGGAGSRRRLLPAMTTIITISRRLFRLMPGILIRRAGRYYEFSSTDKARAGYRSGGARHRGDVHAANRLATPKLGVRRVVFRDDGY
jgi:hypothetical protein